jgi:hypothetical protein
MGNPSNKTKRRINVIDVIIILLVLALIGTVVYRVYGMISDGSSDKGGNYVITFECNSEYYAMISYLKAGKTVYLVSNKAELGKIYDDSGDSMQAVYEVAETAENGGETDGESTKSTDPYRKVKLAGKIKLSSEAVKSKTGSYYTIQGRNISVGSTLEVYTDEAVFTITVKGIAKTGK